MDTNVNNDPQNPQRDFTIALVPGVDTFLPIGRGLLNGQTSYELQYFAKRSEQRSANLSQAVRFDLAMMRFTPYVLTDYAATNRRPSAEIDARVHQVTKTYGGGASAKVGGSTHLTVAFSRSSYTVDHLNFEDVDLSEALGHHTDQMSASFDRALTPLTTFSFNASVQHDRFPASPLRSADSAALTPSLFFKPSALLSGHASVGVTRYRPLNPEVQGFTGLTASVDLSYIWRDWTKFNGRLDRNLSYSFEKNTPYYVMTGFSFEASQNLSGHFDLVGRFGRQYLGYRAVMRRETSGGDVARNDRTVTYGSGLGYRLADDTRVGFNVDYDRRMSPVENRRYDGYRFGGTFTYAY